MKVKKKIDLNCTEIELCALHTLLLTSENARKLTFNEYSVSLANAITSQNHLTSSHMSEDVKKNRSLESSTLDNLMLNNNSFWLLCVFFSVHGYYALPKTSAICCMTCYYSYVSSIIAVTMQQFKFKFHKQFETLADSLGVNLPFNRWTTSDIAYSVVI